MADTHSFRHEPRRHLSDQQRAKLFLDANGKCQSCDRKIRPGEVWHADHILALERGGTNAEGNWQVLCPFCHEGKTAKDHSQAAKGRGTAVAHYVPSSQRQKSGRPMPGTKRSGWKHKIAGGWVRR